MITELMQEKENAFLQAVKEIAEPQSDLFVYGAGQGGQNVAEFLRARQIPFAGFVVNERYLPSGEANSLEELLRTTTRTVHLIVAFSGYCAETLASCRHAKVYDFDCWGGMDRRSSLWADLDMDWVRQHERELTDVYEQLADERSREVMIAFLNQKVSMKYGYMRKTKSEEQYFDPELIELGNREVFVDCGAYDGDTAAAFLDALHAQGKEDYKAIYSYEPDAANYAKLVARDIPKNICRKEGVSDEEAVLSFSSETTSSQIAKDGDLTIHVNALDNELLGESVTFIKMDIEGVELRALKGAENIIKQRRPKLAICVYHKREDLYEIMNYLRHIVPTYRFYLRNYEESSREVVLYAL